METPPAPAPLPPSQDQVLARGVCLAALLYRGFVEQMIQFLDEPALKHFQMQMAAKLNGWLKAQGFAAHLTRPEGESLARALGSWPPQGEDERTTRCEELGVLLWALGAVETLPPYDEAFGFPDLEPLLGLGADQLAMQDDARARLFPRPDPLWLQTLQLLGAASLKAGRHGADAWYWRAQVAASQASGLALPEGATYEAMIREGSAVALEAGAIGAVLDDDFALGDRPYAHLTDGELRRAALIAEARRRVLHWLGGYATPWDDVLK